MCNICDLCRCAGQGTGVFKTLANTFYLQNVAQHPHNFEYRCKLSHQLRCPHVNNNTPFLLSLIHI